MAAPIRRSSPTHYNTLPQLSVSGAGYYQAPTQHLTPPSMESHYQQPPAPAGFPRVSGCSPAEGGQGTEFTLVVSSSSDLTKDSRSFRIMFGSKRCPVSIQKSSSMDGTSSYSLVTKVPTLSSTGWFNQKVPVYFNVEDEHGNELNTELITDFTYTDYSPPQSYETSPAPDNFMRKRRLSGENREPNSMDAYRSQVKRPALQPDIRPKGEDYMAYSYPSASGSSFPSYAQTANDRSVYDYQSQASDRHGASTNWNGSYLYGYGQNEDKFSTSLQQLTNSFTAPTSAPSTDQGNPLLIRTSTLQQSMGHQTPNGSFNPYQLPQKANLALQGDLNTMAENWTAEEWQNKRRLVQFRRTQRGNTVDASFAPVSPSERQANSICISCIWWAERQEAFVTSVDCIYLLEALVGVRFTVEEKNRIRRNLEGFHPLTVSKAKPDSESFFKLIMSFPNPKPRNIEKDVKVFPWKILTLALKKIIGKYSASYSSTASVMSPPLGASSSLLADASPRSDSTSTSVPHRTTASVSPPVTVAHAYSQQDRPAVTRADSSHLSAHMQPSIPMNTPPSAGAWAQLPHLQQSQHMSPQHIPRTSWDTIGRTDLQIPPVYATDPSLAVGQPSVHSMSYQRQTPSYPGNLDGSQHQHPHLPRHDSYGM